jgi:hypothetical protein
MRDGGGVGDVPRVLDTKSDGLTTTPPDGINQRPACPRDTQNNFRLTFCDGNGLYHGGLACPSGGSCNCASSLYVYCANGCLDLPDGSAECQ